MKLALTELRRRPGRNGGLDRWIGDTGILQTPVHSVHGLLENVSLTSGACTGLQCQQEAQFWIDFERVERLGSQRTGSRDRLLPSGGLALAEYDQQKNRACEHGDGKHGGGNGLSVSDVYKRQAKLTRLGLDAVPDTLELALEASGLESMNVNPRPRRWAGWP